VLGQLMLRGSKTRFKAEENCGEVSGEVANGGWLCCKC